MHTEVGTDWCSQSYGSAVVSFGRVSDLDFRCSFCGKDRSEVLGLVAGPKDLFICNERVDAAREVLDGQGVPRPPEPTP